MQLSMRGKGNAGAKGGPNGDLLITIEEEPHEVLHREGSNVIYDLYISIADAALGTSVEVPTIDGPVKIKIPSGTQSGKIFRLKDKGLPQVQAYGKGDQLVKVVVEVPEKISKAQRKLIEELAAEMGEDVHPQRKGFLDKLRDLFE